MINRTFDAVLPVLLELSFTVSCECGDPEVIQPALCLCWCTWGFDTPGYIYLAVIKLGPACSLV